MFVFVSAMYSSIMNRIVTPDWGYCTVRGKKKRQHRFLHETNFI